MFLYQFGMIYVTNLLTKCPVSVPVFCCPGVSEKLFGEVSRNQLKIYVNYFHKGIKTEPGGELQGGHNPKTPPRHGPPDALRRLLELPFRLQTDFDAETLDPRSYSPENI